MMPKIPFWSGHIFKNSLSDDVKSYKAIKIKDHLILVSPILW